MGMWSKGILLLLIITFFESTTILYPAFESGSTSHTTEPFGVTFRGVNATEGDRLTGNYFSEHLPVEFFIVHENAFPSDTWVNWTVAPSQKFERSVGKTGSFIFIIPEDSIWYLICLNNNNITQDITITFELRSEADYYLDIDLRLILLLILIPSASILFIASLWYIIRRYKHRNRNGIVGQQEYY